ncbi:CidA/LrgA family holin-like protein [Gorillibacterium sp. sgz5001074]|uniref:CidA/LrgA family holin-like protein n=1 Tax=Gorillibacterium sp. sgz5001074 TaxID=3446695 RepID=UPI003F67F5AC
MKKLALGTLQVGFFILFSRLMNGLASWLDLPVPGGILGIVVLFLLLQTKVIKLEWIDIGAKWLLAEMLLFFIPPAVGMMEYGDLIRQSGLQLLAAVTGSVLVVMVGSGLIADRMAGRKGAGRP